MKTKVELIARNVDFTEPIENPLILESFENGEGWMNIKNVMYHKSTLIVITTPNGEKFTIFMGELMAATKSIKGD